MEISSTALAFARAIGFKIDGLASRRLQEFGLSAIGTFRLYRYALIPSIIWCLLFIRSGDITQILHSQQLLIYLLLVPIVWNIQVFIGCYVLNSTSSMSGLTALQTLLSLPLILLTGIFFNNDIPNFLGVVAIVVLTVALLIQPSQHQTNTRTRFSMPVWFIVGAILLRTSLEALGFGLDRAVLQVLSPEDYLGIFSITSLGLCAIWTSRIPKQKDKAVLRRHPWLALIVPLIWFGASIPEMFALAALPIYTVAAINTVTFIMDTGSDLLQKRICFTVRTACFIGCVVAGLVLTVWSI